MEALSLVSLSWAGSNVNLTAAQDRTKEQEGGCQVNGPKVAKFLDR